MRRLECAVFVFILLLNVPDTSCAHGVGYRQSGKNPISMEFYYSTGETLSFLETQVFSPRDERFAFQTGRTDEAGRFAFTPDHPGRWRLIVKDNEGHMVEAVVNVSEDSLKKDGNFSAPVVQNPGLYDGIEQYIRATLGVSLLFNIAAVVMLKRRAAIQKSEGK